MSEHDDLRATVKQRYGALATSVTRGATGQCCGGASACGSGVDPITADLYDTTQTGDVPAQALSASLGCGNPTALAELRPGETVLDLGAGGGIDVLLSARRVGPTGRVFGLDMTDEMLALANANKQASGLTNVHFLKGEIEDIPLPDESIDVIISNCVVNLSGDKDRVFKEAYRVLKPGGRLAISDVVVRGDVPEAIRRSVELWIGCIAGALSDGDYLSKLAAAGFDQASIEVTRVYRAEDAREFLAGQAEDWGQLAEAVDGKFVSGFVRAIKPSNDRKERPIEPADVRRVAEASFDAGLYCAESVLLGLAQTQGIASDLIPKIATGFCSGMARTGGPCGALSGAIMGISLAFGRSDASTTVQPTYDATQQLFREFELAFGSCGCSDLLDGCDLNTQEGQVMFVERQFVHRCRAFVGTAAEIAARIIRDFGASPSTAGSASPSINR
jgi:arsenite methyltransferase